MSALAHSEFRTGGEPELRPMKLVVLSQQLDPSDRVIASHVTELLRDGRGRLAYLPSAPDPKRAWFEPQSRRYAAWDPR